MNSILVKYNLRENATVLAIFFLTVHLLYYGTWQAGFVTDFTGLLERLDGAPFSDVLNCFGFPALHQITNFFLFVFYKIFGINALPWYLVYTSLHVVNGWLGYLLVKKMFEFVRPEEPVALAFSRVLTPLSNLSVPAFITALLFLVSPYNAETVIWKVCFNFLFCTAMMLSSLLFLVKYLEKGKGKEIIYSILFFALALFTFELALALPFMVLVLYFFWKNKSLHVQTLSASLSIAPYFILSALYFLLNKIFIGGWVGHYGEGVHLNFDLNNIASNLLKYFSKNLIYWRDWEHGVKQSFISFCDNPITAYGFMILGITILSAGIIFFKKLNPKIKTVGTAWLLFFFALSPLANLYVVWLLHGENDRYGYFSSLFFYIGLIALFQFFNKRLKWFLYGAFLFISVFTLIKVNSYWKNSATIVNGLLTDFRWEDRSEVYVLAFPENYKGIPMFKDFSRQDLALKNALKYLAKKPTEGKFYQVIQFNMNTPNDGLFEKPDTAGIIKLEFHDWGSWWWRHGLGAGSYKTDQYDFNNIPKGCEVTIKNASADAVFIYSNGGKWKEAGNSDF